MVSQKICQQYTLFYQSAASYFSDFYQRMKTTAKVNLECCVAKRCKERFALLFQYLDSH